MNKVLFFLLLVSTFCSCGSLSSFSHSTKPLQLNIGTRVLIKSMDCNTTECIGHENKLHDYIEIHMKRKLESAGVVVVGENEAYDLEFLMITAHEQEIDQIHPRNFHLIVRTTDGEELLQIGLSEVFSTPLKKEYVNMNLVKNEVEKRLDPHITSTFLAAKD